MPPKPKPVKPKKIKVGDIIIEEEEKKPEINKNEMLIDHRIKLAKAISTLTSGQFKSDFVIKTKMGKSIEAHRLILASKSPVLKDLVSDLSKTTLEVLDFDPKIVESMVRYFYSGEVTLEKENVYPIINIADKFKVEDLKSSCFTFLVKTLDTNSCITMIMTAKTGGFNFDSKDLVSKCISFIEKNTQDILDSNGFLTFDKDVVISILQSDNISCDEIDLYNAAIKWGKNQCKDRKKFSDLKEVLSGVMDNIRYPLIDARDLISIVKHDGFMPRELYIWALEYNASPDSFKYEELPQFKQRAKTFLNTVLLNQQLSQILFKFLQTSNINSSKKQWSLLYRASKDGWQASNFHQKCDYQGETITVIKSTNGYIFGGYNPGDWTSSNAYTTDNKAFLFSLVNTKGIQPQILKSINGKGCYTYGGGGYGKFI